MSLPRFFPRVADALRHVVGDRAEDELRARLEDTCVALAAPVGAAGSAVGFVFAANLLARLYPRLVLAGPEAWVEAARQAALAVNPRVELAGEPTVTLAWESGEATATTVVASASGWNVAIDHRLAGEAAPPALLAAAALGVGEVFRAVFADWVAEGRHGPSPGGFNLVTLTEASDVPVRGAVDIGHVHLAGVGAVGQAAVATLAAADVVGELVLVDPQIVELSNLQRYVLSYDDDVDRAKVDVVAAAVNGRGIVAVPVAAAWGEDERAAPGVETVLTALDTGPLRIDVQAGLPRRIYNAGTHPADLGWSRHEDFATAPCLACMYWPAHDVLDRHEEIARALEQPPLRVLAYLADRRAVGLPVRPEAVAALMPPPTQEERERWSSVALLDELVDSGRVDAIERVRWAERDIEELYVDGVCGGGIVTVAGELPRDVLVPMAHQSALAGVMLATQLIVAADDELRRHRSDAVEGRFNVLGGFPQTVPRARISKAVGCICGDADYVDAWRRLHGVAEGPEAGD